MTGLHYPDNLYADHEERKARRLQQPTGAYRAAPEMPEVERKLRTALSYVNHARDLIREALGDNEPKAQREAKIAYDVATDEGRVPKWDPRWGVPLKEQKGYSEGAVTSDSHAIYQNTPPNCDGLSARDVRSPHPMQAEAIRDHDERLAGGEDRL